MASYAFVKSRIERVIDLYVRQGLSTSVIAERFGATQSSVQRALVEAGVVLRGSNPQKNKRQAS